MCYTNGEPCKQKKISDVEWGKHCLVVAVERDDVSITPKGDTKLKEGDELVIMISQRRFSQDLARIEKIINGS
ncbi:MAG: TrkA C-terminal domain-containing protein [Clostridiales bacterium]|nr:TrkA C-terminal domain-containing protein [Clostridiales bacterium]